MQLVTQPFIWRRVAALAVKRPGERDNQPASIEGVCPIAARRNLVRAEKQLGVGAKAKGLGMLALGGYIVAGAKLSVSKLVP